MIPEGKMKKRILIVILIITLIPAAAFGFFRDERKANEVVSDFYSFMSGGYMKYMDRSTTIETLQEFHGLENEKKYKILRWFYNTADKVKQKKIKVLVQSLAMNGSSIDGETMAMRVKYRIKITDRETKKVTHKEGRHRFILKRTRYSWRIQNIEPVKK